MTSKPRTAAGPLHLEDLAMHAFVHEIVEAVENIAAAAVWTADGSLAWSQVFQSSAADVLPSPNESGKCPSEPVKVNIGHGYAAYHFPLDCENVPGCVFTLVIYGVDPPNLKSVSFAISSMLACLSRQIDVDCMLMTTRLVETEPAPPTHFAKELETLASTKDLAGALQRVVDACLSEHDLDGVAVALPAQRILTVATSPRFKKASVSTLLAKLQQPLQKKPKFISATVTLNDGSDGQLLAAPVVRNKNAMLGIVFAISGTPDAKVSTLVRMLANRVSMIATPVAADAKLRTRFELVSIVEETIAAQPTLPHSLMYFDTDKMHTINDAFGYSGGDRALTAFRRILRDSAGSNDCVAHLGGDRFAVFMPGASGDTALAKADQILRLLSQETIEDDRKSINLSASAGVVDINAASKGAEDMLILAEVAARSAQERGGNQSALFQDIDSSIIQRRSDVDKVGFLQMALIENQFILHAQRIQSLTGESGQKFELLARLNTKDAPNRSPAEFLSAAERYQLMSALDRWVINSALGSLARAENPLEVSLSTFAINVSAQSLQDDSFVEFIESRIAETGVAPDTLCFEITETSLVKHLDRAQRFVHRLQRLGCRVALDDFGTGYSSFEYLKTLPANYLKIDGAFVRDLLQNDLSKAIVSAVVSIAGVIGAQTVAEHVENEMVLAWLKEAGVDFVQGFVVHKPEPFDGVLEAMDTVPLLFETADQLDLRVDAKATA
ncbi:MAG: bifunctional diguanylate cyclase/phosphodiesterase [Pseudomonadota bacterium]